MSMHTMVVKPLGLWNLGGELVLLKIEVEINSLNYK